MGDPKPKKRPRGRPFVKGQIAFKHSSLQCVSLSEGGLLLAAGNASGAYQGRNTGPRWGVTGGKGCPLAFACEARPSRTGPGLIR